MIPFLAAALRMATGARMAGVGGASAFGFGTAGRAATAATRAGEAATRYSNLEKQLNKARGKTPLLPDERKQLEAAKKYATWTGRVAENMEKAAHQEQQMVRALTYTTIAGTQVHRMFTGLASTISGHFVKSLTLAVDVLAAAAAPVEALVRLHNPARADLFVKRLADAQAVIGRMLVPVLDAFTRAAMKVGNTMAGLEPVFAPLMSSVSNFIDMLATKWTDYMRKHGGLMENFIDVAAKVVDATTAVVGGLFDLLDVLLKVQRVLPGGSMLGVIGWNRGASRFDPARTAFGASANQARFVSAKTAADEAIKSAMMQGLTPKKSPELEKLSSIDETLNRLYDWFTKTKPQMETAGGAAGNEVGLSAIFGSPLGIAARLLTGRRG